MIARDRVGAETWLLSLPPTRRQAQWVVAVAVCQVAALALVVPYAKTQLPQINGFIPAFEGVIFVTDLLTSVLLFSQFAIYRPRALLVLACGYLFSALLIIPHALTFPGAFSPTGLLGAGLQSTAWLYLFWHLQFPLALLGYGLLRDEPSQVGPDQASSLAVIVRSVALIFALAIGLTLLATAGNDYLPVLFTDRVGATPTESSGQRIHMVGYITSALCVGALGVLWHRRRSLLDQWLMVVALGLILEIAIGIVFISGRYSIGFYTGRMFSLLTSTIVLVVLLAETTRLYGNMRALNETLEQRVEAETRERLQIWNVSQDLLVILDLDGRYISVNPAWSVALGWSEADLLGKSSQWLLHPDDLEKTGAERDRLTHDHRTSRFENRLRAKDGSYHWISWKAVPDGGRIYGMGRDITERKQAEHEMQAMEQELRRAQRLEAMGSLAGGIAHDFNNILGAIVGYGEMALRAADKGTRLRRDLDAIMSAGERGRTLVERILVFSRSGVAERAPVHVEAVVREVLDQLTAKLPQNVTIEPRLHAGRAAILGDSTQVHQVVMNLVNNAVQAMPHGGVLRVSLGALLLNAARSPTVGAVGAGDYIVLKVSDSGTGIAQDVLQHMFEPFFTTKEVGVGNGLGLSLVHGIVLKVGGAIDVTTLLGRGSTFTVYLPRCGEVAESNVHEDQPLPRGNGQRVLIIEDEEPLARLASDTLEQLGYTPITFTSSTRALTAFAAGPNEFDAILTDERMPGLSGSALIQNVRRISPSIPIMLMSGFVNAAAAIRARQLGANEILHKPLLARDLATSFARMLQA